MLFSYLHQNISLRFLTCEPNLQNKDGYLDEADVFYQDPESWLNTTYHPHGNHNELNQPPTHLGIFDILQPRISDFLKKHQYTQFAKFFHSHVPDSRVGSHVIVMCSRLWQQALISSQKQAYKARRQHFFRNM